MRGIFAPRLFDNPIAIHQFVRAIPYVVYNTVDRAS